MRFLAKHPDSPLKGSVYRLKGHNAPLLQSLIAEQCGFCAYTEKFISPVDTCAIEHFNPRLKETPEDGYHNHYGVLQHANQRKRLKESKYKDASFFQTRFFQVPGAIAQRIEYLAEEGIFDARDPQDEEARALIDYLGVNESEVFEARRKHLAMVKDIFDCANFDTEKIYLYLEKHQSLLSYPSALSVSLGLELELLLLRACTFPPPSMLS